MKEVLKFIAAIIALLGAVIFTEIESAVNDAPNLAVKVK